MRGATESSLDAATLAGLGARRSVGRRWLHVSALLLALAAGASLLAHDRSTRAATPTFVSAPVTRRDLTARVTASGSLSAVLTVQVGTQVSGRIQKLYADFNSPVKKGQLVAKIDPQFYEASVEQARAGRLQAEANLASAQASADGADKAAARTRALREQNLASQADLDTAEANVATTHAAVRAAGAAVRLAAAQLHQAEINLSYTNIVSPIDGVVISRSVDVGQTVAASLAAPTIFTIAQDLTRMQLDCNVSEGDIGRLRAGMKTSFTVDSFPGQPFPGVIRQIRNAATTVQSVVTYDAVIDVPNDDLRLRPGMTANVSIVYAESPGALTVPVAALRFHPPGPPPPPAGADRRTAWVLSDGRPQAIDVRPGLSDGTLVEVLEGGLREGDQVIVEATGGDSRSPPSLPAGALGPPPGPPPGGGMFGGPP